MEKNQKNPMNNEPKNVAEVVAPETRAVTEEEKTALFQKEYAELCAKYKRIIEVEPKFKLRDDGTYSVVLTTSIRTTK